MEENKTGVWIQNLEGRTYPYEDADGTYKGIVGDTVSVSTNSIYVTFRIEDIEFQEYPSKMICYKIQPIDSGEIHNGIWRFNNFCDAEPIDMFLLNGFAVINVSFSYKKSRYRNQSINSKEAMIIFWEHDHTKMETIVFGEPQIGKTHPLQTMNEKLEIKTGTILADKIKIGTFGTERGLRSEVPTLDDLSGEMKEIGKALKHQRETIEEIMNTLTETKKEKEMYTEKLKDKIKKVIYVDREMTVKEPVLDGNGKQLEEDGKPVTKDKLYRGMVKVVWNCGSETVAYTNMNDRFNKEEGFKTCVLKYLFGNAGAHDAVDFWTNKYVKYPSSHIEVTESLCKLEEILENDKKREEERKGLPHAKFLRRTTVDCIAEFSSDKLHYTPNDSKLANEFKKLAKKYFPELKGKEIYVNNNKYNEVFVAIK